MKRIVLAALVLVTCVAFATELLAQANQTVTPVPLTPPTVNTTTTTCQVNCDTQAMICQNACIPTTAATSLANPFGSTNPAGSASSGACNLSCTSAQLVCKQRC